ncbi:multicopper oxidase domain-containing protein, partial [Escherichia coli]|uniref:multicopper oxidase domain-containing protein n=2 Tax=Gammaproteobacteria TaxID=1236 RepID=UPI001B34FB21
MEDMGHAAHGAESTAPQAVHSASSTSSTLQHPSMTHAVVKETEFFTATEDHPAAHRTHSSHETEMKPAATVQGWANASTPAGHKALRYADLKALKPQHDTRAPVQELVIRLGGTMERYIWTINGKKFSEAEPLQVAYGERIRLKFINDSMMAHPMHLHGMFMQLENGQAAADLPNKHTLIVAPGKTVSALLTADELGEWAIHCHLLYHMSSGM